MTHASGAGAPGGSIRALALPATFVCLWSTGYLGAKFGLPYAEPFTFLSLRFAAVAAGLGLIALVTGAPWPRSWTQAGHIAVAGLLVHGFYLGNVFSALDHGISAGVTALIVGLQPILTACLVKPFLGERVSARQWLGFLAGFGGVALVVSRQVTFTGADLAGLGHCAAALVGITLGTLYQKRFCSELDLRSGSAIQYIAAAVMVTVLAFAIERREIDWTPQFVFALTWLTLVLSVGAITALFILIRRGEAARVASLFYLVPPVTAVSAWFLFGETLGPLALAGMAIAVFGVALVNR